MRRTAVTSIPPSSRGEIELESKTAQDTTVKLAMAITETLADSDGSMTDKAYRKLEEMIVTLQLPPGEVLTERTLINMLGFRRTPVREALQRLAFEGLVSIIPRKGVFVTDIEIRSQLEILRVRREIERLMARLAAGRRPDSRTAEYLHLASEMDDAANANDGARYIRLDKELALTIAVDCDNEFARRTINLMSGLSRRFWYRFFRDTDATRTASLHARLARAIAARDADAASEISDQLSDYREEFTRATLD